MTKSQDQEPDVPAVRGGQGRSDAEIEDAAVGCAVIAIAVCVALLGFLIVAAVSL